MCNLSLLTVGRSCWLVHFQDLKLLSHWIETPFPLMSNPSNDHPALCFQECDCLRNLRCKHCHAVFVLLWLVHVPQEEIWDMVLEKAISLWLRHREAEPLSFSVSMNCTLGTIFTSLFLRKSLSVFYPNYFWSHRVMVDGRWGWKGVFWLMRF